MKPMWRRVLTAQIGSGVLLVVALGCGDSSDTSQANNGGSPDGGGRGGGALQDGSSSNSSQEGGNNNNVQDASNVTDGTVTGDGSNGPADPSVEGPNVIASRDDKPTIASTGDAVAIHTAYPQTGAGPFPLIVFAHGFQLPPSQYTKYLEHLASFGYIALSVDYPTSFAGNDNPEEAKDLIGGIDWATGDATLGSKIDANRIGMSGHSLGGKLALLAATMDTRIKAAFVLDPVDGGANGCSAPACVEVKSLMSNLKIPTGFIGETTDATGSLQACAPAADNYTTFYAQATSPSVQITALGANHMSFLDDESSCGITCSFCNTATAANADIHLMASAFMVAFYEDHLRGNAAYETYLTGAQATAKYVTTSKATIVSK